MATTRATWTILMARGPEPEGRRVQGKAAYWPVELRTMVN